MDLLNRFEFDAELKQTGVYGGTAGIVKSIRVGEIDYSLTLPEAYRLVLLRSPDIKWKQVVHNGITYNAYMLMYAKGVPEGGIWWWKDSGDIPFNATASQISAAFASDDLLSTALVKGGPLHEAPIFLLLPVGPYDLLEYHRYIRYALTPAGGLYAHRDGTRIATGDCENSDPVALVHNTDELAAAFTTSPPEGRMLKCGSSFEGNGGESTFKMYVNIETDARGVTGTFTIGGQIDVWRCFKAGQILPPTLTHDALWGTIPWKVTAISYDALPETIFIAIADAIDAALEYEAVDRDSVNLQGTGVTVDEVKISFDVVGLETQLSPYPQFRVTRRYLGTFGNGATTASGSIFVDIPSYYTPVPDVSFSWSTSTPGNAAGNFHAIADAIDAGSPYIKVDRATFETVQSPTFPTDRLYYADLIGTDALDAAAIKNDARKYPKVAKNFSINTLLLTGPSVRVFTPKLDLIRKVTVQTAVLDLCVIDEKYKACVISPDAEQVTYRSLPTVTSTATQYFGVAPNGGPTTYRNLGKMFCEAYSPVVNFPGYGNFYLTPDATPDPDDPIKWLIPVTNPFDVPHSRMWKAPYNPPYSIIDHSGVLPLSEPLYAGDYKNILKYSGPTPNAYERVIEHPPNSVEDAYYPYKNTPVNMRALAFEYISRFSGSQPHNNPPPTGLPPAPADPILGPGDHWGSVQNAIYTIWYPNYTISQTLTLSDAKSGGIKAPTAYQLVTYDKNWNVQERLPMYVHLANSPNTYNSYPALAYGQNFLFPWSDDTVSYWSTSSKFTRRGAGGLENETSTSHKGKLHQVDDHLYKLKEVLDPMQLVQFQYYAIEKYDRNLVLISTTALTWNSKALFPWAFTVDAFGVLYVLADLYTHSGIIGGQEYYPLTLFRFDDMTATSLVQTTKLQTFTYKRGTVEDASGYRDAAKTCNAIFRMYVREGRVVIEGPEIRWEAGNGYA